MAAEIPSGCVPFAPPRERWVYMFSSLFSKMTRSGRHRNAAAADMYISGVMVNQSGPPAVQVLAGRRALLNADGRQIAVEQVGRILLELPLTDLQRKEVIEHPVLASALASLHGKKVFGRIYFLGNAVEYFALEAQDGSQLTWSARPGWCEIPN
jgi:hypothetical protein